MSWVRAKLHAFQANGCSIGPEVQGILHRPDYSEAGFLKARQAAEL